MKIFKINEHNKIEYPLLKKKIKKQINFKNASPLNMKQPKHIIIHFVHPKHDAFGRTIFFIKINDGKPHEAILDPEKNKIIIIPSSNLLQEDCKDLFYTCNVIFELFLNKKLYELLDRYDCF